MKKIITFLGIIFFLFSGINAAPTSAPDIIGPKQGPPSRAEINKLKYTKDPDFIGKTPPTGQSYEQGFWSWLWNLLINLF